MNPQRETIRLAPIAPGVLEGEFETADPGTYMIQISQKNQGRVVASQTTGLTVSYSPEYGMPADGEKELLEWLEEGGGSPITKPEEAFGGTLPDKWATQSISEWLLMLAALLLPLDVAVRRLQLPDHWWARLASLWRPRKTATDNSQKQAVFTRLEEKRSMTRRAHLDRTEVQKAAPITPAAPAPTPIQTVGTTKKTVKQPQPQTDETLNRLLEAKKRKKT